MTWGNWAAGQESTKKRCDSPLAFLIESFRCLPGRNTWLLSQEKAMSSHGEEIERVSSEMVSSPAAVRQR